MTDVGILHVDKSVHTALNRGRTDLINLTHDLDHDLDLQYPASYGYD